jgi:hypothetical protein
MLRQARDKSSFVAKDSTCIAHDLTPTFKPVYDFNVYK